MGNSVVFLAVASFVALGAVYGASTQLQLFEAQRGASDSEYTVLARGAALSGLERAKQHLHDDFTSTTFSSTLDNVPYDVTVTVNGDVASVVSTGVFDGPIDTVSYDVRAMYKKNTSVPPLPPYLSYGILAGGNLSMSGTADVFDSEATTKATIHTNGNLNVSGSAARAYGFGSYSGNVSNQAASTFQPPHNPDGDPHIAYADPVEIPSMNAAEIAFKFGSLPVTVLPRTSLRGTLPGGTRENPVVYHALGNVSLDNVTFDGYAVVVAQGDVTVSGTAKATGGVYEGAQESALAVYTEKQVRLSGNTQLHAQIVATGGLSYNGTVDIYGSIVTGNAFSLSGTAGIHYVSASAGLAWEGDDSGDGFQAMSYSEY